MHLAAAVVMLADLRAQVEEVQRTNDLTRRREIIERLVSHLTVQTDIGAKQKRATVQITYAFRPARALPACS